MNKAHEDNIPTEKDIPAPDGADERLANAEEAQTADVKPLRQHIIEERFLFFLFMVALADVYIFNRMENPAGMIIIGFMQVICLIYICKRMPNPPAAVGRLLAFLGIESGKTVAAAADEENVEDLEKRAIKERFLFFLFIVVLLDVYIFTHMSNIAGAIVIGVMQLICLIYIGRLYDIEDIERLTDKLFAALGVGSKKGEDIKGK